jgi:hypothetical protein
LISQFSLSLQIGCSKVIPAGAGRRPRNARQLVGLRKTTMRFKVWDNHFAGYMRDLGGQDAEFTRKADADNAIHQFVDGLTRQDDWLRRLDIHHLDSNLCYHLRMSCQPDGTYGHAHCLLPIFFDVPPSEWKLLAEDGSEMTVGMTVTFARDNEQTVLIALQPPHKMASGGKVIVASGDGSRRYGASVFGGTYKYLPPETDLTAAGLLWASADWQPVVPFDVPPPPRLVLPPHWLTLLEGTSNEL